MQTIPYNATVGQFVSEHPLAAAILEKYQVDYCCRGNRLLADVCQEQRLDMNDLLGEVERAEREAAALQEQPPLNWLERPLTELCDHIQKEHHSYLRRELPRLSALIEKVLAAHVNRHPELREVRETFAGLRTELEMHMMKEEHVLFPAIRAMEQSSEPLAFPFGSVANPIRVMEHEHDSAAAALRRLRKVTADYSVPDDACQSYRELFSALLALEHDLHIHIHKENNILFPRALAMEE